MPLTTALVVDDIPGFRRTLEIFIRKSGLLETVIVAERGWQAAHLAQTMRPDLVIMKIRLPDLDGLRVCQLIKTQDPGMPVILYSDYDPGILSVRLEKCADAWLLQEDLFDRLPEIIKNIRGK